MQRTGSTSELSFSVHDWFAWTPGRETRRAWRTWAMDREVDGDGQEMPALPMSLRRRVTKIGQKAIGAALACKDVERARYVLASRHGEYDRTVTVLTALAVNEAPSPAEFSMSVHHGLAGLLSIHTANVEGHVAVAAGEDSFSNGLMEAALCVRENPAVPVLLIYYDAALPQDYGKFHQPSELELPIAAAILLGPPEEAPLTLHWAPVEVESTVTENQALVCLRWLISGAPQATCTGNRMKWKWRRAA